jgi:murein DD-endopeptidase MepM/ murein hydrolase activator NlpD
VRLGHRRTALFGAVLAMTFSVSAIAVGADSPTHETGGAKPPVHKAEGPRYAFPMRAVPEYGDGLDAGRGHEGQDMFAPAGTPLVAVANAVVIETGSDGGAGNYVSIYDPVVKRTYNYFHMLAPAIVGKGDRVRAGQ